MEGPWPQAPPLPFQGRIGPYHLESVLGQGGMGTVYLARQNEPVSRLVAVKLMRATFSTPADVARFEGEREALARLTHPAIAQIHEAGTIERAPWFAMEYVEGDPLTTYCDARSLSLPARLRLLMEVCRGVQFAHQKGIIHRDLKPGNLLVTEVAGEPHVKIIDFGLAKALDRPLSDASVLMSMHKVMGTPGYMSPESLRAGEHGVDVDTRSDVYALGIILYELVAGMRPFDAAELGVPAVFRLVSTEDAPSPSQKLRKNDAYVQESIAAARGLKAKQLLERLSGDLNWIVAKATAREREERYESAAALAADLERYLNDQPVTARPPTLAYRARKFVRRHRVEVAAAALAGLALVAGIVGILRESSRARRAEEKARAVADFLTRALESADPYQSNAASFTVREMLDQSLPRIGKELADKPDIAAELLETIGSVYLHLGEMAKAEPVFREVLAYQTRTFGPDSLEAAGAMHDLAMVISRKKREEAVGMMERVIDIRRRRRGENHDSVARAILDLSGMVEDDKERERLLRQSLAMREKNGAGKPQLAFSLTGLGWFLMGQGRLAEAEPYLRRALEIRRSGEDRQSYQRSLLFLGTLLNLEERFAEAEPLLVEALPIAERIRGKDDIQVGEILRERGVAARELGKLDDAEAALTRALHLFEKIGSKTGISAILSDLGLVHWRRRNFSEAEACLNRSLSLQGPDKENANVAWAYWGLANVYRDKGDRAKAEPLYRRALAIQEKVYPPDHPETKRTREDYAALLKAEGR